MFEVSNADKAFIAEMPGIYGWDYIKEHFVDLMAEMIHRERHFINDEVKTYYRGLPIND